METIRTDVVICGDSLGGIAAALQLLPSGLDVVLVQDYKWVGGQMTSQAVPPDENPWIEDFSATRLYAEFRERVRAKYRRRGLTPEAKANPRLNPGGGWVSRLCHEPAIGARVLEEMLAEAGRLHRVKGPIRAAGTRGDRVAWVETAKARIEAKVFLDATELGDLLALSGAEHIVGAESREDSGEPNALEGPAEPRCQQGLTWCAALVYDPENPLPMDPPDQWERWRDYVPPHWPGRLFSTVYPNVQTGQPTSLPVFAETGLAWFSYRQIVDPNVWRQTKLPATIMNWPQNDLLEGSVLMGEEERRQTLEDARQLTLCVLYWLKTEMGFPGFRFDGRLTGARDGLAQAPYIREARRALTLVRLTETEVSTACNPGRDRALERGDSAAIGAYRLDLHPRINGRPTLDISSVPYQVPAGCLAPRRVENLIPCCKNIGVTHIANGCTRLHPVEWAIGEAAAHIAAMCIQRSLTVQEAVQPGARLAELQHRIVDGGSPITWKPDAQLKPM